MNVSASDFYTYYSPSRCELRVYLRERGEPEQPPGVFLELLKRLGIRHERDHFAPFPQVVDLSKGSRIEREARTREAIRAGAPVLYQPALRRSTTLNGIPVEVLGDPDFLIREGEKYLVRDSKLARRITEGDHPEILRQLELYGWLAEEALGYRPVGLEVYNGLREVIAVPYDGGRRALALIENVLRVKTASDAPYSPVGWSKCNGCGFNERCWAPAVQARDVAIVSGVDQGLAVALRERGVQSIDELLGEFSLPTLAALQRPWGTKLQRVGAKAKHILRMAQAVATGKEIHISAPAIPPSSNYVMFDLEGIPPFWDELDKTYLWGLQVYGEKPGPHLAMTAGVGPGGDQQGWEAFLAAAQVIFKEYGDLPFVHWGAYERSRVNAYVERFGDPDGIATRVCTNLCNLLAITQDAIALPLPSYSLKVVEGYVGFARTLPEADGAWAIVKYIEAVESDNEAERAALVEQIRQYNEEDLAATWAVLQWLRPKMQ